MPTALRLVLPLLALLIAVPLMAVPARADEAAACAPTDDICIELQRAAALARDGLAKLKASLDAMIRAVPQYDMPRIDDEGNIIIPRRRPPPVIEEPEPALKT